MATDVIGVARELGVALQADAVYQRFSAARDNADSDTVLQEQIGQFNLKRITLNKMMSNPDGSKPRQADIDVVDAELKELYDKVVANPAMIEINASKAELDDLVGYVNQIISASVNGEDPMLVEKKEEHDCGGGCSSCGGGCH